ncbi:MBL fold metallo-hydrolase [Verrucomicrobium sp. BvORR106]|uniref:MBL fold metallo-hydrolase n=1 Tax=Verrucomicrobium sp. BvORR106 TaxID=1403819 RepID=UPI0009DE44D0|nr:MBL fold metallo-hydrolase [Verrucomicrobium sp. BvORR106]
MDSPPGYPPDIQPVWTPWVTFHVINVQKENSLYLIDTGMSGAIPALKRTLKNRGWDHLPIRGIVLTHGHYDHTRNVAELVRETGAWVAAPRLDKLHCEGRFPYRGWSRACGWLEACGRRCLGFQAFTVTHWIDDGDSIPIGPGWTAIHLPGHTDGHMGYLHAAQKLLFTGDLFASFGALSHQPPRFLNSSPHQIARSLELAASLNLEGILPNHGWLATPARHLEQLHRLAGRHRDREPS